MNRLSTVGLLPTSRAFGYNIVNMKNEKQRQHDREYSRKYRIDHPKWKKENNARNRPLVSRLVAEYRRKNPEAIRAISALNEAVRSGKVKRGECVFSGIHSKSIDGHHQDYSKPLEVIWMCHLHHKQFHYGLIKLKVEN